MAEGGEELRGEEKAGDEMGEKAEGMAGAEAKRGQ